MGNSANSKLDLTSREHPMLFVAVWFTLAALLLTCPLIAVTSLLLIARAINPALIIPFLLSTVFLPFITTFPAGAIIGSHILSLTHGKTIHAAVYGLITGLAAFIIWVLLIEVIPDPSGFVRSGTSGGDLPGAVVAVAYLVVLPGIVLAVMSTGALAGVLLYKLVPGR